MVAGCVVGVFGRWWDGWVWMVVIMGFLFVHDGEIEGEEER